MNQAVSKSEKNSGSKPNSHCKLKFSLSLREQQAMQSELTLALEGSG
jgi:hypothetical protein